MDTLATFFVRLMYGSDRIPDFLIDRTGTQYKLIDKKNIIDMLRAKNKSRRKLHRKYSSSSSSEIPSTPAGGGGTNNTTTPSISTVTENERYRQHADEEQYDDDNSNSDDDDDDDDDDADNNDDLVYDTKLSEVQNNESSGPAGFITIQLQSDSNYNSINLNKVNEDTPLGQLAVNFKRFHIFLFI